MKVAVVTEYFPSPSSPIEGIWALRQAQAVADEGVEVKVIALGRPLPPLTTVRKGSAKALADWYRGYRAQAATTVVEGIEVNSVPLIAPPRPISYGTWGYWARPVISRALNKLLSQWPFDLVHAHYAAPAGYAALKWCKSRERPLVISLHGGDLLNTAKRSKLGKRAVSQAVEAADAVLCNSRWTADLATATVGESSSLRVLHLGTDIPELVERRRNPTLVTVANLDPRKRHRDVLEAVALLRGRLPNLNYLIVGDGPARRDLEQLAVELGIKDRVNFLGELPHEKALQEARSCHLAVMPSVDEAFGVSYIETMAAALPAVGCEGEGGPEEIASLGQGMVLVAPRAPTLLAEKIAQLLENPKLLDQLGSSAREAIIKNFSWQSCGRETANVYQNLVDA